MLSHLRKGYKIITIELLQHVMRKPIIKFCNGRNNYIDKNICDCLYTCNMNTDKKQKKITYHTTQICVFTKVFLMRHFGGKTLNKALRGLLMRLPRLRKNLMRVPYAPWVCALCANLMRPVFLLRLLLHGNLSKPYACFHVCGFLFPTKQ